MRKEGTDHRKQVEAAQKDLNLRITEHHGILDEHASLGTNPNVIAKVAGIQSGAEAKQFGLGRDGNRHGAVAVIAVKLPLVGLLQLGLGVAGSIGHCRWLVWFGRVRGAIRNVEISILC